MSPWNIPLWLLLLPFFSLLPLMIRRILESKRQKKKLPPGPLQLPLIGNLHQLGSLPHFSLWNLSKKYGPVMYLKLGSVPMVVVSSPESAREVLRVHDLDCCSRPRLAGTGRLSYDFLDVAFCPYNDYWRAVRKLCVLELFSAKRAQSFRPIIEEEVALLVKSISESTSREFPVDLKEKLLSLTAGIICSVSFGMSFHGSQMDNIRFQKVIREAFAMLGSFSASDFIPYVGWIIDWLTGLHARREKSFHDLDAFYEQAIDFHLQKRKTEERQEDDIIDVLLKLEREEVELGTSRLTKNHIKAILMDIFLGGVDAAAVTMNWALTELVRNPRVMKKLHAEIREHIGEKREVTEDDINRLGYLKMVIKETWRLHPPGSILLPREAVSEFKINGYTIYPKTRVVVNVWAIGRDPEIWKNPNEFYPERFMDNSIDFKGQNFELLPFGSGRRICPGIDMATVMVELALANLLYHFDWKLPEGMAEKDIDVEEAPGLAVDKKIPLKLIPVNFSDTT